MKIKTGHNRGIWSFSENVVQICLPMKTNEKQKQAVKSKSSERKFLTPTPNQGTANSKFRDTDVSVVLFKVGRDR